MIELEKYSRKVNIYYLGIILITVKYLLDRIVYINNHGLLNHALLGGSMLCFAYGIWINSKYSYKELAIIGTTTVLCLYSYIKSGDITLLVGWFIVVASRKQNSRKIIQMIHYTKIVVMIISVIWYINALFLFQDTKYMIYHGNSIAHHFGFSHPNGFGVFFFWVMFEHIYLKYEKMKIQDIFFYFLSIFTVYKLTFCDTAFYVSIILFILIIVDKGTRKARQYIPLIAKFSIPVCSMIIGGAVYIYHARIGAAIGLIIKFDDLITGRIRLGAKLLDLYGWSIIGQRAPLGKIEWDQYYRVTLLNCDGLYEYLFFISGIIFLIFISFLGFRMAERRENIECIMLIGYAIYGMIETQGLNLILSFPLLLMEIRFVQSIEQNKFCTQNMRYSRGD